MNPTSTCPKCQGNLDPGVVYCPLCGSDVSAGSGADPASDPNSTQAFQLPPQPIEILKTVTLGSYEILGELGRGGMATVYLAHEVQLERKVAIKLMSPEFLSGPDLVERFKREARTAGALSHPHIIPIYAVKEEDRVLYFVMKYVPGRPLDAVIADVGALPVAMVRQILIDVGGALDYAHRKGVIHRDVKPGNIMLDDEGHAVVTDFGIAKALESTGLTRSGTMVGTPSFLSPEGFLGDAVTPAADQYSLGVVAYQMLAGALPFEGDTSLAMMYAHVHTPPMPIKRMRPDCPPELQAAIMRMLEKSPEDRFPNMKEAVSAIAASMSSNEDEVRRDISMLARNRPDYQTAEHYATPTSPIPTGNRVAIKSATRMMSSKVRRRAQLRKQLLIGAGTIAVVAGVWFLRPKHPAPPPEPAPRPGVTASPEDSMLLRSRGAATYARQLAVDAGATAKAMAPGDSLLSLANGVAGRSPQAAVKLIDQAVASWADAGRAATRKAQAAAAATAAVATKPAVAAHPEPEVAAPPPPPSDSEQIVRFYDELATAIRSRQLGEVKRLLPNLSGGEEKSWRSLFDDKNVSAIEASWVVEQVGKAGEQATARVYYDLAVTKKGKLDRRSRRQQATFTLGPRGWRQIRVEDIK